jgi:tRNA(fMet)-specific endonuclease VapC
VFVFERFRLLNPGTIGISSITAAEFEYGVNKSLFHDQNRNALQQFLIPLEIVDFGYGAAARYGIIRNQLEKAGKTIGPLDMLIAAHAQSIKAILVTNNVKEFERVDDLEIENWAA